MSLRQARADPEPIRIYEAAPKAVASNVVFLAAWLAGTTGYFLSILATSIAQCIRWLPFFWPDNTPPPTSVPGRASRRPPRPKPIITHPLFSRENAERHVAFSLEVQRGRDIPQPHPLSSENMTCTTASFSSGDSTLCSSPLSDLGDLPPLKNLPPVLLDPQMPDQIQVKKRPMTANFPIKARNPFKFRRASISSAPSPTPEIGETLSGCPPIERCPASPGPRKPSLIKRLNMTGRRSYSVNAVTGSPSSTPTSPMLSPSLFRDTANASKRSASMDVPAQTTDSSFHEKATNSVTFTGTCTNTTLRSALQLPPPRSTASAVERYPKTNYQHTNSNTCK